MTHICPCTVTALGLALAGTPTRTRLPVNTLLAPSFFANYDWRQQPSHACLRLPHPIPNSIPFLSECLVTKEPASTATKEAQAVSQQEGSVERAKFEEGRVHAL